jgi:hypothetical protein
LPQSARDKRAKRKGLRRGGEQGFASHGQSLSGDSTSG